MLTSAKWVDELATLTGFNYAHTYNANPLACAVGSAVLKEISDNQLLENTLQMGSYIHQQLKDLQNNSRVIGDVRGRGLLLAIEFVANKDSKKQLPFEYQATEQFKKLALQNGLFIYGRRSNNGQYGEHVLVSPPLNITKDEADLLIERLTLTVDDFEQQLLQLNMISAIS